jgi:adenine-specific DNA-methyltransferase
MADIENFPLASSNIQEEQLAKLKELFPEAFTEGNKVDWDKLRLTLGGTIDTGKERYGMNWPGKADCFKTIQQPSIATLVPARDESVDFDTTQNLFIEGDNLEVLKLLQKSYLGKIKMIYIDPPYNTGSDFIYPDNYTESLETYLAYTGQVDAEGKVFSTNADTDGRFHSKWMNMMYPRLFLAKNLLKSDGVIFISIGQNEFSNLMNICNELFGEENKIGAFVRLMKTGGNKGTFYSPNTEFILIYAKNIQLATPFRDEISKELIDKVYTQIETEGIKKGEYYRIMGLYQPYLDERPNQRYFIECPDGSLILPEGKTIPQGKKEGEKVKPNKGDGVWRWTYGTFLDEKKNGNVLFKKSDKAGLINEAGEQAGWNIYTKIWLKDREEEGRIPVDLIDKYENRMSSQELKDLDIPFDFAKPAALIGYLMKIAQVNKNDIVLDFFAGSCSTSQSVILTNLEIESSISFICVQLPELTDPSSLEYQRGFKTIADIGKERIRRVINNIKKEYSANVDMFKNDIKKYDLGFKVYKLKQSNFKIWNANVEKTPEAIQLKLIEHVEHISPEAAQEAILYELLLKSGFELATKIEKLSLADKSVYSIADGELLICLEKQLTHEVIKAMAEKKPSRVICLDEGFQNNDQLKTNAVQIMKSKGVLKFQTV